MANRNPDCDSEFTCVSGYMDSAEALIACGEALARRLDAPRTISLSGPLGAGKTHFVKGLSRGLDCLAEVSSPTFTLVHEYDGGRCPLVHFDFYRLESATDLDALGWHDYLAEPCIIAVEWGDRFPEALPTNCLHIAISIDGDGRHIQIGGAE